MTKPDPGDREDLSQGHNPWAPPAADLRPPDNQSARYHWLALPEGIAIGLIMGMVDINLSETGGGIELAYFGVALVLGAWRGKWAWLAWPPIGVCLYLVHLVAIGHGYQQPFVEANSEKAIGCFWVLVPCGMGIGMGAFIRWGVKFLVKHGV